MTIVARDDVERFVARPDPRRPVILLYGPDAGLVAERAAAISAAATSESDGALTILRLEGDDVAGDPLRLADEANAIVLFGGRRAIRVRVGGKNVASAVEPLLRAPPLDAIVLLEAGDLRKTAPLRALCEKSPHAAAIACYADEERGRARLIDEMVRAAGLAIDPDARDALVAMLGGDRLTLRGEIEKLIAYRGEGVIALDDVEAAIGDSAAIARDQAIDGAYSGAVPDMLTALAKLSKEGERPDAILATALAHGWTLANALAQVEGGLSPRAAAERAVAFPPRRAVVEKQLGVWAREGMTPTIRALGDAIEQARLRSDLGKSIADRAMLRIALAARKSR